MFRQVTIKGLIATQCFALETIFVYQLASVAAKGLSYQAQITDNLQAQ
jgi:hypothetical protein